jgi:hypothetical protein
VGYEVKLKNINERQAQIAASKASSTTTYPFQFFRDSLVQLKEIRADIGLPIYRMANFRTSVDQLAVIREQKRPSHFFSKGEEDEEAQQEQHIILWKLAQKGRGDSIIPVSRVLKADGQKQPLIVTAAGVVVNGNRRLAAMRELGFKHVDLAVLPDDAVESDIIDIELSLQMTPETKLPYGWIEDALAIESLLATNRTKEQIMARMRMDEQQYYEKLGSLEEARLFLNDYMHEPEQFELVEDQQQLFHNGYKAIKNKKSPDDKECVRAILYNIADRPKDFGSRAYDFITPFEKNFEKVKASIQEELSGDLATYVLPTAASEGDGLIPEDLGAVKDPKVDVLTTFLLDTDNAERVHFAIKEAVNDFRENRNSGGEADKERLRKARKHLVNVDFAQVSEQSKAQIGTLITEIESLIDDIKQRFARISGIS